MPPCSIHALCPAQVSRQQLFMMLQHLPCISSCSSAVLICRANCKQSCNLCPTSSPAIGCTKYTWVTGQWGVCNSTCSIGFHNRSVSCLSYGPSLSLQSEADPALCNEAVKPENITTCTTSPCADDYSVACSVTAASGRRL